MRISYWSSDVCSSYLPGRRRAALGRSAQHLLRHAEIAGKYAPVLLIQLARRAAFDELLDIGGIAVHQAREIRIAVAPLGNHPFQHHARIFFSRSEEHTSELPSLMRTS